MKIHVTRMDQETVENYDHVVVSDNHINFLDISDNECQEILANDVLDNFSIDKVGECITSLVNKLRLGGTLVVGGKDVRLFAKAVLNNGISEIVASEIVNSCQSMSSINDVVPVLQHLGLKIINTNVAGIHYEVKASRG
jgi:hypothetical protein